MKPTKEQIEYYIQCADLEMGPVSSEEWVEETRRFLRKWPKKSSCEDGHEWEEVTTFGRGKHVRCRRIGCGVIKKVSL